MIAIKCILFFLINISILLANSISELSDYSKVCREAAESDEIFKQFKQHPEYREILEHVTYEQGSEYLKIIEQAYPFIMAHFEKCRENDLLGSPTTFCYGEYGNISPTTLRYMKVSGDLLKYFGDLDFKTIVEIGGGYGGQCKILNELTNFKEYIIVD